MLTKNKNCAKIFCYLPSLTTVIIPPLSTFNPRLFLLPKLYLTRQKFTSTLIFPNKKSPLAAPTKAMFAWSVWECTRQYFQMPYLECSSTSEIANSRYVACQKILIAKRGFPDPQQVLGTWFSPIFNLLIFLASDLPFWAFLSVSVFVHLRWNRFGNQNKSKAIFGRDLKSDIIETDLTGQQE